MIMMMIMMMMMMKISIKRCIIRLKKALQYSMPSFSLGIIIIIILITILIITDISMMAISPTCTPMKLRPWHRLFQSTFLPCFCLLLRVSLIIQIGKMHVEYLSPGMLWQKFYLGDKMWNFSQAGQIFVSIRFKENFRQLKYFNLGYRMWNFSQPGQISLYKFQGKILKL